MNARNINPLFLEKQKLYPQFGGDHWGLVAAINSIVNKKVRVGTVLRHVNYCVDLFQVVAIRDADDHWRGENNLIFELRAIHSDSLGDMTFNFHDERLIVHSYDLHDEMYADWVIESEVLSA